MFWMSKSKLTFHNFTSEPAAAAPPANDDDPLVTLHHHSCMVIPLLAEKRMDMKGKVISLYNLNVAY